MEKHASTQETVRGQNVFEWYEALISAALVLVLVFSLFFRIIQVDGESMVPTLQNGDKLIVWGAGYEPQRGDVVIVDSYTAYGKPLVKRVIAKGGQTVRIDCQTGTVFVDGKQLTERYAVLLDSAGHDSGVVQQYPTYGYDRETRMFEVTVPEGHLFVMGDNRNGSTDSRDSRLGMVDERYILGHVQSVVFPISDFGTVK